MVAAVRVRKAWKLPPGSRFCTTYSKPAGAALLASEIVKVVAVDPLVGLTEIGTFTFPDIPGWMVQW